MIFVLDYKRFFSACVAVIIALCVSGCREVPTSEHWSRYQDQFSGYEISYPENYHIEEVPDLQSVAFISEDMKDEILVRQPAMEYETTAAEWIKTKEINTYKTKRYETTSKKDGQPRSIVRFQRTDENHTLTGATFQSTDGKIYYIELEGRGPVFESMVESFTFVPYQTRAEYLRQYFEKHLSTFLDKKKAEEKNANGFHAWRLMDIDLLTRAGTAKIAYQKENDVSTRQFFQVQYTLSNRGEVITTQPIPVYNVRGLAGKKIVQEWARLMPDTRTERWEIPAIFVPQYTVFGLTTVPMGGWILEHIDFPRAGQALVTYSDREKQQQLLVRYKYNPKEQNVDITGQEKRVMWWTKEIVPGMNIDFLETFGFASGQTVGTVHDTDGSELLQITVYDHWTGSTQSYLDQKSLAAESGSVIQTLLSTTGARVLLLNDEKWDSWEKRKQTTSNGTFRYIWTHGNDTIYEIRIPETLFPNQKQPVQKMIQSIRSSQRTKVSGTGSTL